MKYNRFVNDQDHVSRLGYGAMGLSGAFGHSDHTLMIRSILEALDQGINFIDTARAYGTSESIIALALKEWRGERPFIASKVIPHGNGWGMPVPIESAYPKGSLRASVEESLKQLQLDYLDLIQMHQYWPQWDDSTYWLDELFELKKEGKVKYIGVSVPDHRQELALPIVMSRKIDAVQTIINIFDPIAFDCLVPICQKHNVSVIARCVLDEGGLAGFLKEDTNFAEHDFRNQYFDCVPEINI